VKQLEAWNMILRITYLCVYPYLFCTQISMRNSSHENLSLIGNRYPCCWHSACNLRCNDLLKADLPTLLQELRAPWILLYYILVLRTRKPTLSLPVNIMSFECSITSLSRTSELRTKESDVNALWKCHCIYLSLQMLQRLTGRLRKYRTRCEIGRNFL
jgi:hypothetical protein